MLFLNLVFSSIFFCPIKIGQFGNICNVEWDFFLWFLNIVWIVAFEVSFRGIEANSERYTGKKFS